MRLETLIRIAKKPRRIIRPLGVRGFFNWLPDKPYLKLLYWAETGKKLDLENPKTYNEKLQWIKLYDRKPEYTKYADKFAVRSFVKEKIGEEYLVPLINTYDRVEDIDWDALPNQFVLKCTHGSGTNIICPDKSQLNIRDAETKLQNWMKRSSYWFGREWCYKDIKPKIVCEKYMGSDNGILPFDYKVMCFNGIPKLVQVHIDRYKKSHTNDFYDINWTKTKLCQGVPNSNRKIEKPKHFQKMLNFAALLSKNTFYARIDFYEQDNNLFFGEITLYPTSGFTPFSEESHDSELGSWINLPRNHLGNLGKG